MDQAFDESDPNFTGAMWLPGATAIPPMPPAATPDASAPADESTNPPPSAGGVSPAAAKILDNPLYKDYQEDRAATRDALGRQNQAFDKQEALLAKAAANRPPVPQQEQIPKQPKQNPGQGMMEFMQIAVLFGALAGRRGRQGATAALNAFAGSLKGFAQGNMQVAKQQYEEWKNAAETAVDNNKIKLENYRAILEDKKMGLDEQMEMLKIEASKAGNEMVYHAADMRDTRLLMAMIDKDAKTTEKTDLEIQKLKQQIEGGPPGGRSAPAAALMAFKKDWKEKHNGQDAPPEEISKFNAHFRAQQSATTFWEGGGKGAAQLQSVDAAMEHIGTLEQLASALNAGNSTLANRLYQSIGSQFGVPAPKSFDAAVQIVGPEVVKAIQFGPGAMADRQEEKAVLDRTNSPAQMAGVIATTKRLMAGQLVAAKRRFMADTGQSEEEFNVRLSDSARALVGQQGSQGAQPQTSGGGGGGGWGELTVH